MLQGPHPLLLPLQLSLPQGLLLQTLLLQTNPPSAPLLPSEPPVVLQDLPSLAPLQKPPPPPRKPPPLKHLPLLLQELPLLDLMPQHHTHPREQPPLLLHSNLSLTELRWHQQQEQMLPRNWVSLLLSLTEQRQLQ